MDDDGISSCKNVTDACSTEHSSDIEYPGPADSSLFIYCQTYFIKIRQQ